MRFRQIGLLLVLAGVAACASTAERHPPDQHPFVVVLGVSQDGGVPQAGTLQHPGWDDPAARRLVACLGIVDPLGSQRWLVDATPDFKEQLHRLDTVYPVASRPGLDGIFITHAHMGHYTGLVHLGHEAIGTHGVRVFGMPRLCDYLCSNGPWSQLVSRENIVLQPLQHLQRLALNERLTITPLLVPHRQEYSEVAGFLIEGPQRSLLYVPDIDSWEDWDRQGTHVEDLIRKVDVAYLDGTFYANGELPGRDMSGFPHPFVTQSLHRFSSLPAGEREKIRFIHFNHTNPALDPESDAARAVEQRGFSLAREMECVEL
ncbi:MAG: MBL fold metallo-hydrolase [Planctomycetota bacterium]